MFVIGKPVIIIVASKRVNELLGLFGTGNFYSVCLLLCVDYILYILVSNYFGVALHLYFVVKKCNIIKINIQLFGTCCGVESQFLKRSLIQTHSG